MIIKIFLNMEKRSEKLEVKIFSNAVLLIGTDPLSISNRMRDLIRDAMRYAIRDAISFNAT